MEDILYPNNKKNRPLITYNISEGSVRHLFKTESTWVDAEFYFYGILKDAGGKNKANIHLDTEDYGYLTIETGQSLLMGQEENMLYKKLGVRAVGKQDIETGEVDTKSLRLIEFIDYNPKFDEAYLSSLIAKAKQSWKGINTADWLSGIRGKYEV